jgi:hypothetical protein
MAEIFDTAAIMWGVFGYWLITWAVRPVKQRNR